MVGWGDGVFPRNTRDVGKSDLLRPRVSIYNRYAVATMVRTFWGTPHLQPRKAYS